MDAFDCCICLDVFVEPQIFAGCGHSFCKGCIQRLQLGSRGQVPQCPSCRNHSNTKPNFALQALLPDVPKRLSECEQEIVDLRYHLQSSGQQMQAIVDAKNNEILEIVEDRETMNAQSQVLQEKVNAQQAFIEDQQIQLHASKSQVQVVQDKFTASATENRQLQKQIVEAESAIHDLELQCEKKLEASAAEARLLKEQIFNAEYEVHELELVIASVRSSWAASEKKLEEMQRKARLDQLLISWLRLESGGTMVRRIQAAVRGFLYRRAQSVQLCCAEAKKIEKAKKKLEKKEAKTKRFTCAFIWRSANGHSPCQALQAQ